MPSVPSVPSEPDARSPWGPAATDDTSGERRPPGRRRHFHLAGALSLVALIALAAPLLSPEKPSAASDPLLATLCYGAASMEPASNCVQPTDGPVTPAAQDAPADRSAAYDHDCQVTGDFTDRWTCVFGDPTATRSVALVGNSHGVHWLPALHELGLKHKFKVTTYLSARCFVTTTRLVIDSDRISRNCAGWGRWVRESTANGNYDLIVQSERTYGRPVGGGDPDTVYERGYKAHLQEWADAGKTVLVIRDTPKPATDVPACVLTNPDDYGACTGSRDEQLQPDPLANAARSMKSKRMRVADLTNFFCQGRTCLGVIGRMVVYFDGSHITASYARSVAPYLEPHVLRALEVSSGLKTTGGLKTASGPTATVQRSAR